MYRWFAGVLVLTLAAGCSAPREEVRPTTAREEARRVGVQKDDCDRRASYRPAGALPRPGRMPAGSTMARIASRGRLVVGVSQTTYLFGHRDPTTGDLVGLDIDIAREIAAAVFGSRDRIQFKAISSAQRVPVIRSGEVDLVVRATSMTCDRWKDVAFSSQYFQAEQRLLVLRNSQVRSIDDLGGKRVCAAAGSTDLAVVTAARSRPVPVPVAEVIDCLVLLQLGQVDAISNDDAVLLGFVAQDPYTRIVGPSLDEEAYGIMMPREDIDLVRFVNGVLARMRDDGSLAALHRRWLGPVGKPPPARYRD